MKNLLVGLIILTCVQFSFGQTAPVSDNETSSVSNIERIQEIDKELDKLDKKIKKGIKAIEKSKRENEDSTIDKNYNRKQQIELLQKMAEVKNEMKGHDLGALNDKVKRLERNKRKISSQNNKNQRSIAKKLAQIERLKSEIRNLEDDVKSNDSKLNQTIDEIESTEDVITKYALIEKNDRLGNYDKELTDLKREEQKLISEIEKNKNNANRESQMKETLVKRKQELQLERTKLSSLNSTGSIPHLE